MVSKDQENFLVGALVGGAVGAAAALLLTPYSGSEIRKRVRQGINQINGHGIKAKARGLAGTVHKKAKKKRATKSKTAAKTSH